MSDELMYTSAPRGLRPGSSGFCTVAATASLGPAWIERLEAISGYKPMFAAGDPRESENPVSFAHVRVSVAGQTRNVLSRICFSGFDHTGRSNKFAHHVVLNDRERASGGPAWMMRQPALMTEQWDGGEPRALAPRSSLPDGRIEPRPATAWRIATGDAGWAGVLAGYAAEDPATIVYVIYEEGNDVLALIDEAIRLLPETRRWQVTFNTYLTESPSGIACAWRFVVRGSDAAELARGNVLDLGTLTGAEVPATELVDIARTGYRETAKSALPASNPMRRAETAGGGIQSATYAVASESPGAGRAMTSLPRNLQTHGSPSFPQTSRRRQVIFSSVAAAACLLVLSAVVYVLSSRHDASLALTTSPTSKPALPTPETTPATRPAMPSPPSAVDAATTLGTTMSDRVQTASESTSPKEKDITPKQRDAAGEEAQDKIPSSEGNLPGISGSSDPAKTTTDSIPPVLKIVPATTQSASPPATNPASSATAHELSPAPSAAASDSTKSPVQELQQLRWDLAASTVIACAIPLTSGVKVEMADNIHREWAVVPAQEPGILGCHLTHESGVSFSIFFGLNKKSLSTDYGTSRRKAFEVLLPQLKSNAKPLLEKGRELQAARKAESDAMQNVDNLNSELKRLDTPEVTKGKSKKSIDDDRAKVVSDRDKAQGALENSSGKVKQLESGITSLEQPIRQRDAFDQVNGIRLRLMLPDSSASQIVVLVFKPN